MEWRGEGVRRGSDLLRNDTFLSEPWAADVYVNV